MKETGKATDTTSPSSAGAFRYSQSERRTGPITEVHSPNSLERDLPHAVPRKPSKQLQAESKNTSDLSSPLAKESHHPSAVDAMKFGAFLATDPTGGVLVLCNMLLRYVLEDESAKDPLAQPEEEVIRETRLILARQSISDGGHIDVGSYADMLFTPGEALIKLIYDALRVAVEGQSKSEVGGTLHDLHDDIEEEGDFHEDKSK